MNIANVTSRFMLLSGASKDEAYRWRPLIDDALGYISSKIKKSDLSENDIKRLEALCAVYALRLYRLSGDESITSFKAGDLSVTSPADGGAAEKLWREYADKAQDLIDDDKFLFGRVV